MKYNLVYVSSVASNNNNNSNNKTAPKNKGKRVYGKKCTEKSPLNTGRKLNVHEKFKWYPGRLRNVLCTFNLYSQSRSYLQWLHCTSLVIRQNGESQNGHFKKTKHVKFSENDQFLPPDSHTYVSRGNRCSFSENLTCFVFLKHPFWDSLFCLVNDEM